MLRIFKPWANHSPAISASYSASLLDAWNSSLNDYSRISPVGDVRWIPMPDPFLDEDPLTWRTHVEFGSLLVTVPVGSSTKKSASTWDFALVLSRYSISYSLSSTAHLANRPDWLGLSKIVHRGKVVRMMIVWDWKYGQSFRADVTIAYACFFHQRDILYNYMILAINFCTFRSYRLWIRHL